MAPSVLRCHLKFLPKWSTNPKELQSHKTQQRAVSKPLISVSTICSTSEMQRRVQKEWFEIWCSRLLTFSKMPSQWPNQSSKITTRETQQNPENLNLLYKPLKMKTKNLEGRFELGSKTGAHLLHCHLKFLPKFLPPILKNCNHTKPKKEQSLNPLMFLYNLFNL